jgi:hypothetical protein
MQSKMQLTLHAHTSSPFGVRMVLLSSATIMTSAMLQVAQQHRLSVDSDACKLA